MKSVIRLLTNSSISLWLVFMSACTTNSFTSADYRKVFSCLSLDPKRDYIFYEVINSKDDFETWAFSVSEGKSVLLPKQSTSVKMPIPPGNHWLLFGDHSINALELDSCQSQPIYKIEPKYKSYQAVWLGRDLLLISAFEEYPFFPDLSVLDLNTKTAEKLVSDKFIQATSIADSKWIQADGITLEAVQWHGSTTKILEEFDVDTEISPGAIQFLPSTDEFIFVAARKDSTNYKIWKSSLKTDTPQVLFEPGKDSSISFREVSPNGDYLGFVEQTPTGYFLNFLNLRTNKVDFKWPYPFTRTNPEFRWSPDSRFIAMTYEGTSSEPSSALFLGIQVMEINSGKLNVLLEKEIFWLLGWYSAK